MHVLNLPPAFVLSQDQTLKLKRHSGVSLTFEPQHITSRPVQGQDALSVFRARFQRKPGPRQTVKLTLRHRTEVLAGRYAWIRSPKVNPTARISLRIPVFQRAERTAKPRTRQGCHMARLPLYIPANTSPSRRVATFIRFADGVCKPLREEISPLWPGCSRAGGGSRPRVRGSYVSPA